MKIHQLDGIDYEINEAEAFGKSVFNNSEYTVTLAVPAGTELDEYIKDGDQITGSYTVSGLETNFESILQDVSYKREFKAGYDLYDLTISENALTVERASILDVPNGGTGSSELNGVLKGNGQNPVTTAVDGVDYWSPNTLEPPKMSDNGWLVEHMGGTYFRLFKVHDYGSVNVTQANNGQYISPVLASPPLPTNMQKMAMTFATSDSAGDTLWWLMSQPNGTRIRCAVSGTFKIQIAVTAICQIIQ